MQPVITIQIIIYLFFSPVAVYILGGSNNICLSISTVFLITYILSYKWHMRGCRVTSCNVEVVCIRIQRWFSFLISGFTLLYIFEIIRHGLVDRRIGSEAIAELISSLPLFDLAVIRVYELMLYPFLAVAVYSLRGVSEGEDKNSAMLLLGVLVAGFFFTGILDSRGKLLAPLLYFFALFIWPKFRRFYLTRLQVFALFIVVIFGAIISYNRSFAYNDLKDFILVEFVSRTNGLFMIESLIASEEIGFWGALDLNSLKYYLAFLPFLEYSKELKSLGLTSSKGYFIQDLLGLDVMDGTISVITEPFYIFGYLGVVIAGVIWGLVTSRFDFAARYDQIFSTRVRAAFYIAVLINFIKLESEFVGTLLATGRDFFIIYIGFLGIKFSKTKLDSFQQG